MLVEHCVVVKQQISQLVQLKLPFLGVLMDNTIRGRINRIPVFLRRPGIFFTNPQGKKDIFYGIEDICF